MWNAVKGRPGRVFEAWRQRHTFRAALIGPSGPLEVPAQKADASRGGRRKKAALLAAFMGGSQQQLPAAVHDA